MRKETALGLASPEIGSLAPVSEVTSDKVLCDAVIASWAHREMPRGEFHTPEFRQRLIDHFHRAKRAALADHEVNRS